MNQISFLDQAHIFLQQANDELARGDLRQASEKAWGAAAQAVKAAGEAHGWEHDSHRRLFRVVRQLDELSSGQHRLMDRFSEANRLHQGFYEGQLSAQTIREAIAVVSEFVTEVGALMSLE